MLWLGIVSRQTEKLFRSNGLKLVDEIISGGQTGVDRAALDVAIFLEIDHGGWCPKNRLAEDGTIPPQYLLQETESRDYAVRTEKNVLDSDGTLILYDGVLKGGTRLTVQLAQRFRRPLLMVDLTENPDATETREWISKHGLRRLNIAGPRESTMPGITELATKFLITVFDFDQELNELNAGEKE
jgi:hypothetical protein